MYVGFEAWSRDVLFQLSVVIGVRYTVLGFASLGMVKGSRFVAGFWMETLESCKPGKRDTAGTALPPSPNQNNPYGPLGMAAVFLWPVMFTSGLIYPSH